MTDPRRLDPAYDKYFEELDKTREHLKTVCGVEEIVDSSGCLPDTRKTTNV